MSPQTLHLYRYLPFGAIHDKSALILDDLLAPLEGHGDFYV
jgi:hypothetical protein